ncbi:MAG TPA: hypothetical protein VMR98_02935, partial [Candidatus Polarisedimenticolaceae bacterium]|nr:hypothetical protein [Candidatus Polarisedimenticolaceae bacterium]
SCVERLVEFYREAANAGLQLRRAISIQAEGIRLLEDHAIAPSAARLCYAPKSAIDSLKPAWVAENWSLRISGALSGAGLRGF